MVWRQSGDIANTIIGFSSRTGLINFSKQIFFYLSFLKLLAKHIQVLECFFTVVKYDNTSDLHF
jgi:hypothetical protein